MHIAQWYTVEFSGMKLQNEMLEGLICYTYTVNSLMFARINVCVFEAKPCSQGLMFVVAYFLLIIQVHMNYVCGYLFLQLKDGHEFRQINPSQTLMIYSNRKLFNLPYDCSTSGQFLPEYTKPHDLILKLPNVKLYKRHLLAGKHQLHVAGTKVNTCYACQLILFHIYIHKGSLEQSTLCLHHVP